MFGNWPKLTIGQIQSVPIRLDVTFVLVPIFALNGVPIKMLGQFWHAVAAGTIGLFLSILFHELGHTLTAKRYGVGVDEIVIGGFYGYARLHRQTVPRPFMIRIIAAGPLVNLVIFVALCVVMSPTGLDDLIPQKLITHDDSATNWHTATLLLLAAVNLAMFVFNFLPAFPLDGGRILGLVLDGRFFQRTSVVVVSALGIVLGSLMILFGMTISVVLSLIGLMILSNNIRRLRRLRRRK